MNKIHVVLLLNLSLLFLGLCIFFEADEWSEYYKELYNGDDDDYNEDTSDNYFLSTINDHNEQSSSLLVSALSSLMKYPIYGNKSNNDNNNIWQEIKFDEIHKLNLIGDKLSSLDKNQLYYNHHHYNARNDDDNGSFNIKIKKFYGRVLHLKDLHENTTVGELKLRIKKVLRADTNLQRIVFNGRKVVDDDKDLQYYGIKKNSVLHLDLLPFSSSPSYSKDKKKKYVTFKRFIDPTIINKLYNNSFILHNEPSSSQCSWMSFSIDKKPIVPPKGWKFSYHGTSRFKHNSIADQGNILLSQLQRQEEEEGEYNHHRHHRHRHHRHHHRHQHRHPHSHNHYPFKNNDNQNFNHLIKFPNGIFTTPDLQLAEFYGKTFYFKGEKYKVIFQHLVKEKSMVKIKRLDNRNYQLDEYWISPCEGELKPVGILIKKIENCGCFME